MRGSDNLIQTIVAALIWLALTYPLFAMDSAKSVSDSGEQNQQPQSDWLRGR